MCGDIQNKSEHNKEITGNAGCAVYLGYQSEICSDNCGYNKQLPKTEHIESDWKVYNGGSFHIKTCTVCGEEIDREECYDSNGNILGCRTGNSGRCVVCKEYKSGNQHA